MLIDLRSDTVTQPTAEMLQAMIRATTGDDVYGEDKSVIELENRLAQLFGMESGLFCPSGTMTNQIAIKVHTRPGDEVICADNAHVFKYEGGGMAFNSGVQARVIAGDRGRITAEQVTQHCNADDVHFPVSRLVCLENTSNRGGGSIYDWNEMVRIKSVCKQQSMALHLDGARIFNALAESDYTASDLGTLFDSVSVCLSKGLGAPVGSVLLGNKHFIKEARRVRKVFGGGMRQAGYLAAAGTYALQYHIDRLKVDHAHAQQVIPWIEALNGYVAMMPVETNIVIFEMRDAAITERFHQYLASEKVSCGKLSATGIRFVFHLDIHETHMNQLQHVLSLWKG